MKSSHQSPAFLLSNLPFPPCAYTGIGARATPPDILLLMRRIARVFALRGLTLRSGGAPGADAAFEAGCDEVCGKKEIFLPWKGFNRNLSPYFSPPEDAKVVAALCHPNWRAS